MRHDDKILRVKLRGMYSVVFVVSASFVTSVLCQKDRRRNCVTPVVYASVALPTPPYTVDNESIVSAD